MAKDIEVEIRGILNKDQYDQTKTLFEKLASLKENKSRILIDYSTFLPGEGIRDRQKDIRVRVTNGVPEIVVKLGSWGGSESRRELSFKGKEGEFGIFYGEICAEVSGLFFKDSPRAPSF